VDEGLLVERELDDAAAGGELRDSRGNELARDELLR
jgi:hypothetical protein